MVLEQYKDTIRQHIEDYLTNFEEPHKLYTPMKYILSIGGKHLRSVSVLMATDAFGGDVKKALDVAMAVEIFHNFTLVHDDIMDRAKYRRGELTVHHKWNKNTAILSGDVMLILAYDILKSYEPQLHKALSVVISKTAREVCEGQEYDMEFENRQDVTYEEYLHMIGYKTAVLMGASLQLGAIISKVPLPLQQYIYDYGYNLGLAFQLQDDYLDTFGNQDKFGKKIGGDIIENKKTSLYIKAINTLDKDKTERLKELFSIKTHDNIKSEKKIQQVKQLFKEAQVEDFIKKEILKYTQKSFKHLEGLSFSDNVRENFKDFGNKLMDRVI